MAAGATLKYAIGLGAAPLEHGCYQLWTHPRLDLLFPEYLFRLYHAMRTTVPMMALARGQAESMASGCPVAARLVPYFTRHMREETDHDEWLLDDIVELGFDRDEVRGRLPTEDVAGLMGSLYYWILHEHPVTLLGYFAVTEGSPLSIRWLDRIARDHGIPRLALRTMRKHAVLDRAHGSQVFRVLDTLPLTERHREAVSIAALGSLEQLQRIVGNVLALAPRRRRRTA